MRRSMLVVALGTAACSSDHMATGPVASRLAFTVQPSVATAGVVIAPSLQVTALDDAGAVVTSFSGTITIALAANPGSATLSGTLTRGAIGGVATFSDLRLNRTGSGYSFRAASGALTAATSAAFSIAAAPPQLLAFLVQPTAAVAGAAIAPAVQVAAHDSLGNLTTGFTGNVTIAIGANPGGGTLSGGSVAVADTGVATFSGLNIDKPGAGYTLLATAAALASGTSQTFSITVGAPAKLAFAVQPSGTLAGASITPPVQVVVEDAAGNVLTGATNSIAMAIGTNPGGGTLSGTTPVSAVNGVALFPNLSIDKAGTGYTLQATSTGLAAAVSSAFTIASGAADHLAFFVQPSDAAAGAAIAPAVKVEVEDAIGNRVTTSAASVTVAILDNPSGGVLSGTVTLNAVAGVATFSTLSINKSGTGYTFSTSAAGLTGAVSNDFNVTPGAAARVSLFAEPSNTTAGAVMTPSVQVEILDGFGNRVPTANNSVTLAFAANPGAGTLSGTLSRSAVAGLATFDDLTINKVGNGYKIRASAAGLTPDTSLAFNVTPGAATNLIFTVQPSQTAATAAIAPAVKVTALDPQGNTATSFNGSVAMGIVNNAGGGTLSGALSTSAAAGVATFANLHIDKSGVGYTLGASATGLSPATSLTFNITVGTATRLAFFTQPIGTTGGVTLAAVQVEVQDAGGNRVTTAGNSISMAFGTNGNAATLSGTTPQPAASGLATFDDLSVDSAGTGYTLAASASGLTGATSTPFAIAVGAAAKLGFLVPPSNTVPGQPITPDIQVEVRDLGGNRVTSGATVAMAIGNNPGSGTLGGTVSHAAVSGLATFPGLSINNAGSGYTLVASSTGLASATSPAFDISVGTATKLGFFVQPTATTGGAAISPAVQVEIQDVGGNRVAGATNSVTLAIGTNPDGFGALSGTKTVPAVNGVATFNGLSIDSAGAGYTLDASASGLTGATSNAFNVTVGPAAKLGFRVPPSNATGGATITPAVQVEVQDAGGNRVTSATHSVSMSISTNPKAGTLSGTTALAAVSGVATFNNLSIDSAGTGYRLAAAASGLIGATSPTFNITVGPATQLGYSVQPSDVTAGTSIAPAVKVEIRDAGGNRVTTASNTVGIAIGTNPGGGTLSGATSHAASNGVATFSNLSINKSGAGYTLAATSGGLTPATSAGFTVTADGVSASLSMLASSADTVGQCTVSCSAAFQTSTVTVTVKDQFGNLVSGSPVVVSANGSGNIFSPTGSGTTDVNGVFTTAYNAAVAENKTLSATAGGTSLTQNAAVAVMPVLVGAGDIADCNSIKDDATANQLDSIPGVVFADGDNAYANGTATNFTNCYDPTWGRHKARTRPVVGNHEYDSSGTAAPYFAYFGAATADPLGNGFGYYSYDVGAWHVVVLNSDSGVTSASSNQLTWLQSDLVGRTNQCVLALWHRPLFTSGSSGGASTKVRRLWQALENAGAEVVVNGHDHLYERFAPQDSLGNATSAGIREFIAGTGGGESHTNYVNSPANVEASDAGNFSRGVLRLTLYPNAYRWEFLAAQGFGTYADSGSGTCH